MNLYTKVFEEYLKNAEIEKLIDKKVKEMENRIKEHIDIEIKNACIESQANAEHKTQANFNDIMIRFNGNKIKNDLTKEITQYIKESFNK